MAKITELPLAGTIDGSETVMVVKGGVASRTSLSELIEGAVAPAVAAVEGVADEAAGYAAAALSASNSVQAASSEYDRALQLWRDFQFPTWTTNASYNLMSDSTGTGTGWSNTAGYNNPKNMFESLRAGTATIILRGVSGKSSVEMLADQWTPLSVANKALTSIIHTIGLNDILPQGVYFNKNFAANDVVLGNVRAVQQGVRDAAASLSFTGRGAVIFSPPEEIKKHDGQSFAADFKYYRRRARRTYENGGVGPYFVDTPHLFEVSGQRSGPDRYAIDSHGLTHGPSLTGGTNGGAQIVPNAAMPIPTFTAAPATAGYELGRIIFIGTGTSGDWWRLESVAGTPTWVICSDKHFNEFAGLPMSRRAHQLIAVLEGRGAPVLSTWSCPVAQDVAAGTTIANIPVASNSAAAISTVGKIEIIAGDPQGCFAISNAGLLVRTAKGSLVRNQIMRLLVRTWSTGLMPSHTLSWVKIYITEPSTDLIPRPITIIAPGVKFNGMEGHQLAASRKFGFAITLKADSWAAAPYLVTFSSEAEPSSGGGSDALFYIQLLATERPTITIRNNAGTNILYGQTMSPGHASGNGRAIPAGTKHTMFFSADLTTGTLIGYLGDLAFSFATNGTFTYLNEDIPWDRMRPAFLSLAGPNVANASSNPFTGQFYGLAFWADFIDWTVQANRRAIMNADGSNPSGAFRNPIAGKTPVYGIVGDKPKLLWGDPGYTDAGGPTKQMWTVSGILNTMAQDLTA